MKIWKIYSNDQRFSDIEFNDGLNVILGTVLNKRNLESSSHNLGKSTLIDLIDFLFLKELTKGHFIKDNYDKFKDHVFFMELKVKDDYFVTIKRGVKNHTKISIKTHKSGRQDFKDEFNWDYVDLPLTTEDINRNPKIILNYLLGFADKHKYNYRTYLGYFLRSQYDYDQIFKLSKYRGADIAWKAPLAELFGYNSDLIIRKYECEMEFNKEENLLKDMEKELKVSINDLNQIEALIDANQKKKAEIENKIDTFDFYLKERELNKELIEEIEEKISEFNSLEYRIRYEISKIENSLSNKSNFDLSKIQQLYKEVNLVFPDQLKNDYKKLIKFNEEITSERNKFLTQNLKKSEEELQYVLENLTRLNAQRNEILSVLTEKDSFVKFKKYQQEIIEIENEISHLLAKLDNLEILRQVVERKKELFLKLQNIISEVKLHFATPNPLFKSIQSDFTELVNNILNETAIIYHRLNTSNNIEFEAKITSLNEDELTSKSDGYSYRKMLCVCFDISVLVNYNSNNFFKFVYHDGSLESMSDTKKIKYIKKIREICNNYDVQYILTTLADDIPEPVDGEEYSFAEQEIILTLDDRENDEGRLFGFEF